VRFNESFVPGDGKHDYDIKKKLINELPGICNTILKAYYEAKERGHLSARDKVHEEVKQYEAENNTVVMFLDNVLVKDEAKEVKVSEVYNEYVQMCEMGGHKPLNNVHFSRQISKLAGLKSHPVKKDKAVYRVYTGVTLNKEY
jgi:phage/plasmid-associated DNA primase